jgi:hypothetical protein
MDTCQKLSHYLVTTQVFLALLATINLTFNSNYIKKNIYYNFINYSYTDIL